MDSEEKALAAEWKRIYGAHEARRKAVIKAEEDADRARAQAIVRETEPIRLAAEAAEAAWRAAYEPATATANPAYRRREVY
jgi:hypothetical protein